MSYSDACLYLLLLWMLKYWKISRDFVGHFEWCHVINTLRPRQNGRHFPDDIFKCIFLNENVSISIKISLKFVPKGPANNVPALVQIMGWRRPGDKLYLDQWWLVYWRIYASLGLNENPFELKCS